MSKKSFKKAVNDNTATKLGIALQGGGSYGAYAKGVLKALFNSGAFKSPDLDITAITGTSAGAVNGALLTYGLNSGDMDLAIQLMDDFWNEVGESGRLNSFMSMMDPLSNWPNLPLHMKAATHFIPKGMVSRQIKGQLEKYIPDWEKIQNGPVKLFVNAVHENSKTGKRRQVVFTGKKLTADTIAASGALKELGAYEIDGEKYYDGAYWRNPCMSDIKKSGITDLLVITLQRVPKDGVTPEHQDEARARHDNPGHDLITEEIHNHIAYIHKHHPDINLHVISLDVGEHWDRSSRMNTDPKWLEELEQMGYEDGQKWLKQNARHLGQKSTYEAPTSTTPQRRLAP